MSEPLRNDTARTRKRPDKAGRRSQEEAKTPARPGPGTPVSPRLKVSKTYKLFINGAFSRSESGRTIVVTDAKGAFAANAARASRKDVRDAVRAARAAQPSWAGRTPYNRGQILYRIAEMMEGRAAQLTTELRATGLGTTTAAAQVDAAIDRWVWYAGWADKIAQITGSVNPVTGPFLNISTPEPVGVVAVIAPDDPLLGLASVLAPVIVTGNTAVLLAAEHAPLPAITFAEVLATSDLPAGVVNILTGHHTELAPWLASHMDVNAIDLTAAPPQLATECATAAAENLKRVLPPTDQTTDWTADPGTSRITAFLETKTTWHTIGR
jgi:acyl-CoA reductase-like NAD-dependent aldehyde dehydrogenase